jgi:DNA mismatch repair protein MSH4
LFKVAEAIAVFDMISAFSHVMNTSTRGYIRPEFGDKLAIRYGRHRIMERMLRGNNIVANDTFATEEASRVHIITGANMSGKSVYLRQIALLVMMSQIGCFVPADYAMFRIFKSLHARMCNGNPMLLDLGTNSSSSSFSF